MKNAKDSENVQESVPHLDYHVDYQYPNSGVPHFSEHPQVFGLWPAVFGMALLVFACGDLKEEKRQVFSDDDVAVIVVQGVEMLYSDSALVRVRVTGPVMHNFTDRENMRQEFPNGVRIDFLEPNLSIRSTLTAKTAVRLQDKSRIIARDSVVLVSAKQEKLETEELIWDEKTAKVFTEKFVKVSKPGEIIYGFGLEAEQDFSYWKITVPKGRIKVEQLNEVLK